MAKSVPTDNLDDLDLSGAPPAPVPGDDAQVIDIQVEASPPKRRSRPVRRSPRPQPVEADEAPKSTPLRRAERGERLQVYLPPELEIEVRVKAARERCSMSDLVTRSLEMYLGK